ncbi:MAG: hypothetical protein QOG30_2178 [Acidimicrobiaceae bacterium]|jgi:hypothetical protein
MQKFRGRAILGSVVVAGAIGVAGFAFTASNTVPDTKAGDGTGTVSGYVVSSVHYGLNATDPSKADSVTFNLDSTPKVGSTIKTKVGGVWYGCTNTAAAVTCDTTVGTQATVQPITSLQVVVAD